MRDRETFPFLTGLSVVFKEDGAYEYSELKRLFQDKMELLRGTSGQLSIIYRL